MDTWECIIELVGLNFNVPDERNHYCRVCGLRFKTATPAWRHVDNKHVDEIVELRTAYICERPPKLNLSPKIIERQTTKKEQVKNEVSGCGKEMRKEIKLLKEIIDYAEGDHPDLYLDNLTPEQKNEETLEKIANLARDALNIIEKK